MTEWQKAPFTEVIDFQEGPGILAKDFRSTGVPLVRLSGLDAGASVIDGCNYLDAEMVAKKWAHFGLAEGDILLSTSASLGRVVTVNAEGVGAIPYTGIMRMRPRNERVYAPYIRYMLESPEFQKQAGVAGGGSVLKHFGPMHLKHMYVHLPSLGEQKTITAVLASIDAKIDLNNRINAELEALAKTIYDYWFVQFDFPDAEGRPYKSSGGKMVWNEELKREIPGDWEAKTLSELGSFRNGINYDPSVGGDAVARIVNVRNVSATTVFLKHDDLDELALDQTDIDRYLVTPNSILIARSGIPGATRMMKPCPPNTIYCGFVICLTVADAECKLPLFFRLKQLEQSLLSQSSGSILKNVSQDTLKEICLAMPNERSVIERFNASVNPLFAKINAGDLENTELIRLRDWLLPLLMNGQVRVA